MQYELVKKCEGSKKLEVHHKPIPRLSSFKNSEIYQLTPLRKMSNTLEGPPSMFTLTVLLLCDWVPSTMAFCQLISPRKMSKALEGPSACLGLTLLLLVFRLAIYRGFQSVEIILRMTAKVVLSYLEHHTALDGAAYCTYPLRASLSLASSSGSMVRILCIWTVSSIDS